MGNLVSGSTGVNDLLAVVHDWANQALGKKLLDGRASQASVYPQTVRQDRWRDHLVLRDLVHELVVCTLIEKHLVAGLLLHLSLGPLLLLTLAAVCCSNGLSLLSFLLFGSHVDRCFQVTGAPEQS
jgi:hypothetical protein